MTVRHLPASSTPEAVAAVIAEDGCAVIDDLASAELLDRIDAEMAGYVDATPYGVDEFAGPHTRRTGGLVARSAAARELVLDDLVLGTCDRVLDHVQQYQLHLTQLIRIEPGGVAQMIHRDHGPSTSSRSPPATRCSATRSGPPPTSPRPTARRGRPGSHLADDKLAPRCRRHQPAETARGSVLLYVGSLYHGGGANTSDADRVGVNITYSVGWLRQEENQYLTVPPEVARELPERLQRLLGYSRGAYALGYVDDLRDPLDVLMGGRAPARRSPRRRPLAEPAHPTGAGRAAPGPAPGPRPVGRWRRSPPRTEQERRDDAVGPPVVRGGDHREHRRDRVEHDQPSPRGVRGAITTTATHSAQATCTDGIAESWSEMPCDRAVHRLVEQARHVDEPELLVHRGGVTGTNWMTRHAKVVIASTVRQCGYFSR